MSMHEGNAPAATPFTLLMAELAGRRLAARHRRSTASDMRYGTFMTIVERQSGLPRPPAERAVHATLETLAERISGGEAEDIAAFLPRELRRYLTSKPEPAEPFDLREFVRRVARREGVDEQAALEHAMAVFVALGVAVAPGELRDMAAQLPTEYEPLLQAAGLGRTRVAGLTFEEPDVAGRVAELNGLDRDAARRATEAVLQVLAVRISAGEVQDLEDELPPELRPALERGLAESRAGRRMTEREFLARVAELEGVSLEEAERHAHAVFQALREILSDKEFSDVTAQLSEDFAPLLA
jgi:uncharacterized protein (DUF2267 family)